jgi:hypothetical protein
VPGVSPRDTARLLAIGRLVFGIGLIARPSLVTSPWLGARASEPAGIVLGRALGIRDVAIATGLLAALGGRGSPRPWLIAGAVSDAVDLTATVLERDSLPGTALPAIVPVAGSGALLGAQAAAGIQDS